MSRAIIVSRHPASVRWLMMNLVDVDAIQHHLDLAQLRSGDCVYGNLTAHLVAQLNDLGVRYFHLQIQIPEHLRGVELDDSELMALNPCLTEIRATVSGLDPPHLVQ
tara:strand:+ start:19591 stop:19911 length:321 start_codon:yes stop_codon:yes gene_type:complete